VDRRGAVKIEIPPVKADISQIVKAKDGKMVSIEDDVQNVANDLAEIDPHFRLRYSETGKYFVVYWKHDEAVEDGDGYLVTTAQDLDQRIVQTVKRIHHQVLNDPRYSFADEVERVEEANRRIAEHNRAEEMGPKHEKLAHALKKDLHLDQERIFVPRTYKPKDVA
jgi:hypothetical protein